MKALVPIYLACWALSPVVLGWAIRRWWKSVPRFETPNWRSRLALAAFSLGGLSLALWYILTIRGLVRGARYYDAIPLDGWGSLAGLAGFLCSLPAKGNLKWPAFIVSAAMVFVWVFPA